MGCVKDIFINLLKKFLISCWILGMCVDFLINIILLILDFFMLLFFKIFLMILLIDWNNFY